MAVSINFSGCPVLVIALGNSQKKTPAPQFGTPPPYAITGFGENDDYGIYIRYVKQGQSSWTEQYLGYFRGTESLNRTPRYREGALFIGKLINKIGDKFNSESAQAFNRTAGAGDFGVTENPPTSATGANWTRFPSLFTNTNYGQVVNFDFNISDQSTQYPFLQLVMKVIPNNQIQETAGGTLGFYNFWLGQNNLLGCQNFIYPYWMYLLDYSATPSSTLSDLNNGYFVSQNNITQRGVGVPAFDQVFTFYWGEKFSYNLGDSASLASCIGDNNPTSNCYGIYRNLI
jgi:hypothetical protein